MTRLENIKSNAFLLGLNMKNATKEQKIQWLCQIIDNETEKPEDEMDFALIGECSAYLRELSDKDAEATQEQKQRILQQIKAHHNQTATNSAKVLRPHRKTTRKVVAIAIAATLILTLTISVIAKVKGYSNAWEYVKENIQKIIGLDAGERMDDNGITLIKHDSVVEYNSIEELLQTEEYDIMYPSELPEGIQITKISQQIIAEDYILYSIQFTDPTLSVVISTQYDVPEETLEKYDELEHSLLRAYLVKQANGVYQVIAMDDKYQYLFYGNNYDVLIGILDGMKGIEK